MSSGTPLRRPFDSPPGRPASGLSGPGRLLQAPFLHTNPLALGNDHPEVLASPQPEEARAPPESQGRQPPVRRRGAGRWFSHFSALQNHLEGRLQQS